MAILILASALAIFCGCGGSTSKSGDNTDSGTENGNTNNKSPTSTFDAGTASFKPFIPATRVIFSSGVVITDVPGAPGCAMRKLGNPGQRASLIFAEVGNEICPDGTYLIKNTYNSPLTGQYDEWDEYGSIAGNASAVGGWITFKKSSISNGGHRCKVDMHLLFPGGGSWDDSFAIDESKSGDPYCAHNICNPACKPWQTCNESGVCENISCVLPNYECSSSSSSSPACCDLDWHSDISCNESLDTPGAQKCCIPKGVKCRSDSECCAPFSCFGLPATCQ